jgi:hypothetical protein
MPNERVLGVDGKADRVLGARRNPGGPILPPLLKMYFSLLEWGRLAVAGQHRQLAFINFSSTPSTFRA